MKKLPPPIDFADEVDNFATLLKAVKLNGFNLKSGSARLRDNKQIVKAAINSNCWAFKYASDRLKNDREIALEAVRTNGENLKECPHFNDDIEVVKSALEENGESIQYASDTVRDNMYFTLLAIESNGCSVNFISNRLKQDTRVALALIQKYPSAIDKMSVEIQEAYKSGGKEKVLMMMFEKKFIEKNYTSPKIKI